MELSHLPALSTPERIVQLIVDGDPEGEALLYETYHRGLLFLARREYGQEAEDCVQETWAITIDHIRKGKVNTPAALSSYIRTILKRLAWQRREESRRFASEEEFEIVVATRKDSQNTPEQTLAEKAKWETLHCGLEQLKPQHCEILQRFYLDGQSKEEICTAMGLSETQFRFHKNRAKEKLQALITKGAKKPVGVALTAMRSVRAAV